MALNHYIIVFKRKSTETVVREHRKLHSRPKFDQCQQHVNDKYPGFVCVGWLEVANPTSIDDETLSVSGANVGVWY